MSKPQPKKNDDDAAQDAHDAARLEVERKHMLVQIATPLAASILRDPGEKATSAEAIAEISVDIAEHILERIGL